MPSYVTLAEFPLKRENTKGYLLDLGEVFGVYDYNPAGPIYEAEPTVEGTPVSAYIEAWAKRLAPQYPVQSSDVLGWLSADPSETARIIEGGNWKGPDIVPMEFLQGHENLVVYLIDAGSTGSAELIANIGIDNNIAIWINGQYRFGAYHPIHFYPEDLPCKSVSLGPLQPGLNALQIMRNDWYGWAGADWHITASAEGVTDSVTPPVKPQDPVYAVLPWFSDVLEGRVAAFEIETTHLQPGTELNFTLSGVQAVDIDLSLKPDLAQLNGTLKVGAYGKAVVSIPIAADRIAESETLTLSVYPAAGTGSQGSVAASGMVRLIDVVTDKIAAIRVAAGSPPILLQDMDEAIQTFAGKALGQSLSLAGAPYDLADNTQSLIYVLRNGNFTDEFREKIRSIPESAPFANANYQDLVNLFGRQAVNEAILFIGTFSPAGVENTTRTENNTVTAIFAPGVISNSPQPYLMQNMDETIVFVNGQKSSHVLSFGPERYDYDQYDNVLMTVLRNGEFTQEFRQEIREIPSIAEYADARYQDIAAILGEASMPAVIMLVASLDGNFVG